MLRSERTIAETVAESRGQARKLRSFFLLGRYGPDNQYRESGWGNGTTFATCILPQCLVICSNSGLTGKIGISKSECCLKICDSRGLALISPPEFMVGGAGNRSVGVSKSLSAIMPSRKQRRSVAFAPDDEDTTTREVGSPFDGAPQAEGNANSGVWVAFCEEYHEGIAFLSAIFTTDEKTVLEQLPLTLQRAFTLIRELDDQAQCEPSSSECLMLGLTTKSQQRSLG